MNMKKLAFTILLLLCVGGAASMIYTQYASPEAQLCAKVEEQCGADVLPADGCREAMDGVSGDEITQLARCVEPSGSCLESLGCISGTAIRNFGKGLSRGVSGH